jgi:hypothetical protein
MRLGEHQVLDVELAGLPRDDLHHHFQSGGIVLDGRLLPIGSFELIRQLPGILLAAPELGLQLFELLAGVEGQVGLADGHGQLLVLLGDGGQLAGLQGLQDDPAEFLPEILDPVDHPVLYLLQQQGHLHLPVRGQPPPQVLLDVGQHLLAGEVALKYFYYVL